jgi:hypothetical protein
VPYAVAAGALTLAAVGYLVGNAHAGTSNNAQKVAADNTINADLAAATTPTASTSVCEPGHRGVAGTLKAINGSSLTVGRPEGGTVTVKTSPATTVHKTVAGSVSDIKDGQTVAIHGTTTGQNAIAADQIALLAADAGPKLDRLPAGRFAEKASELGFAFGTVTKTANGTFTVNEPGGTSVAITTSSTTKVIKTVVSSVKDLTVGQPLVAIGTANSDGSVTAIQIEQGSADLKFGKGFGLGPIGFGRFGFGFGHLGDRDETDSAPAVPAPPATPAAPASVN